MKTKFKNESEMIDYILKKQHDALVSGLKEGKKHATSSNETRETLDSLESKMSLTMIISIISIIFSVGIMGYVSTFINNFEDRITDKVLSNLESYEFIE